MIRWRRMIILYEKDVFYDSDCLTCFLAVKECGILQQLFSKVIVPLVVKEEILHRGTPQYIKDNFNELLLLDFVEIREMGIMSKEYDFYDELKKEYPGIGDGEAAVIALVHENGGVIASNNLRDVRDPIEKFDLNFITTAFILAMAYENQIKSREELDEIWQYMLKCGRKRSLPKINSFTQYYDSLYLDDMQFMGLD